ncbi:MAG: hypothetical protein ACKOC8_12985 [Pirellulales bacterium]
MTSPSPCRVVSIVAGAALIATTAFGAGGPRDPELAREPSWRIPAAADLRASLRPWLDRSAEGTSAEAPVRVRTAWDAVDAGSGERLDAVVLSLACGDPRVTSALTAAGRGDDPPLDWLSESSTPAFVRDAVMLWWGRELVRRDRFDEALPLLAGLDVQASVDPAALLFHRAACQHWLLATADAAASLEMLLEREGEIPVRYARVASLLLADLDALRDDSLDHIARRMRDVTRRLDQGRTGAATRDVQDGVIASLDKLIKDLEDRQQGQQGAGAAGAGSGSGQGSAGRPMDDSRLADGKSRGDVQKRDLVEGEGWGDLPPHERERALQQIGREFPPHYREAIEEYFKRLASGAEERRP